MSVAVLLFFSIMFPAPQQPKQPAPAAGAKADGKQAAKGDAAKADVEQDGKLAGKAPAAADQPAALPEVADAPVETEFVTLGSLDPASGYRMLVTLTNAGAAVRRAEMSSARYLDSHDWNGYLGELELKNADDGVQVQVVGAGTPAAEAGIQPGDVIVAINQSKAPKTLTVAAFKTALKKTEPGDSINLEVRRGDGKPQSKEVKLVRRPLAVLRPEIENYEMRDAEPPPGFVDPPSLLVTMASINGKTLNASESSRLAQLLEKSNWEVGEHNEKSATFRRVLPELKLELTKRYSLAAVPPNDREDPNFPGYHLKLDLDIRNTSEETQSIAYRLDGPTGMPLEGWWFAHKISRSRWMGGAGLRDVVVRFDGSPVTQIDAPEIAEGVVPAAGQGAALAYAGVDGQYFAAVVIPERQSLQEVWFDSVEAILAGQVLVELETGVVERLPKIEPRTPPTFTNVTCRLTRIPIELEAGRTKTDSYRVFIGPKRPDLLAQYKAAGDPDHSLADIIYYGLALFGAVARLMLLVLHFFHGIVGNYGIAIIMLTVLVRGLMFPISYRQTKNMARMQALKPEMDRITEKYKTDMQKRSEAMRELYSKHQINPLGGCLPVFLQLPIFIGLYRSLMVDVELRQSPLFWQGIRWCSDLAAPDMLWNWSGIMPSFVEGFLGPYLNILPLITVALFLVTQKMSMPEPTNEQAAMQQKMMKYMTVVIGFLFYKVASGLCLYFIASSLWGIAERKLLPKNPIAEPTAAEGAGGTGLNGKRSRGGGPKPGANGSANAKARERKAKRKK